MSDNKALHHTDDPTWVFDVPDDNNIAPPVKTREQELPFGQLSCPPTRSFAAVVANGSFGSSRRVTPIVSASARALAFR